MDILAHETIQGKSNVLSIWINTPLSKGDQSFAPHFAILTLLIYTLNSNGQCKTTDKQ